MSASVWQQLPTVLAFYNFTSSSFLKKGAAAYVKVERFLCFPPPTCRRLFRKFSHKRVILSNLPSARERLCLCTDVLEDLKSIRVIIQRVELYAIYARLVCRTPSSLQRKRFERKSCFIFTAGWKRLIQVANEISGFRVGPSQPGSPTLKGLLGEINAICHLSCVWEINHCLIWAFINCGGGLVWWCCAVIGVFVVSFAAGHYDVM